MNDDLVIPIALTSMLVTALYGVYNAMRDQSYFDRDRDRFDPPVEDAWRFEQP